MSSPFYLVKIVLSALLLMPVWFAQSYAQSSPDSLQIETSTNSYLIGMNVTGSPVIFDKPHQAIPFLANGTDYAFDIRFMNQGNLTMMENVNYNVVVLLNEIVVFNAAEQVINQNSSTLYSANGSAALHYKFEKLGFATVRISIAGIDSRPIDNESADFPFQIEDSRVIPEFDSIIVAVLSIAIVVTISRLLSSHMWNKLRMRI